MTGRWKVIVGIAGLLVLAAVGIGLAVRLSGAAGNPAAASAGLSTPQQERLQKGITARTIAVQASVVAKEVRSQFLNRGQPLLPPGSRLSISGVTFHVVSAQMATVDATETGPSLGYWQLILVREAGHWQLLGTRKLS